MASPNPPFKTVAEAEAHYKNIIRMMSANKPVDAPHVNLTQVRVPLDDDFDFDSLNTVGVGTPNSETTVTTTSSAPNDQQKPMIVNIGEAPAVVSPMAMQSTLVQSALFKVKQEKQLAKLKRLYVATWPMMNERLDAELEKVTLSPSFPTFVQSPRNRGTSAPAPHRVGSLSHEGEGRCFPGPWGVHPSNAISCSPNSLGCLCIERSRLVILAL